MAISLISLIKPQNGGAFPVFEDIDGLGGFQVQIGIAERNNIPTLNRKEGMWVYVVDTNKVYTLSGGITNSDWIEFEFATPPQFIVVQDISTRNGIPSTARTVGMWAHVISDDKIYTLSGGTTNANWQEVILYPGVIVDGGTPSNIRANRVSLQSPIDNTKNGIVNLGSRSEGSTIGAVNHYSTISGGDQNTSDGYYSTVSGGFQNTASGTGSTIHGGSNNIALGTNSSADGYYAKSILFGSYAHASSTFNNTAGSSQYTRLIYNGESVNAVAVNLVGGNNLSYSFTNNMSTIIRISIVARNVSNSDTAGWVYDLLTSTIIGETTIVAGPTLGFTSNSPGYNVAITIIDDNVLRISFSGLEANTVRAVATIEITEILAS